MLMLNPMPVTPEVPFDDEPEFESDNHAHLCELEDEDYEAERLEACEQDRLYVVRRFYGLGNDCN